MVIADPLRLSSVKELARSANSIWAIVALVAYALAQWVVLVIIARLGALEALGQYALALALTAPVMISANMRLRFLLATDVRGRFPFHSYFATRLWSSILALVACVMIAYFSGLSSSMVTLVMIVAVLKGVEAVQDILLGRAQQVGRMDKVAWSSVISGLTMICVFGVFYAVYLSLWTACLAMVGARLLILLTIDRAQVRSLGLSMEDQQKACVDRTSRADQRRRTNEDVREILALAWPLGVAACLDSLNVNIPRYFLAGFRGNSELGEFAAVAYVAFAGFVLVNGIAQAWVTHLARIRHDGTSEQFVRASLQLLLVAAGVGIGGIGVAWLFGDWLLTVVYGPRFKGLGGLFVLIMVAGAFSYLVLAAVHMMTALGKLHSQVFLYAANCLVVIIGCAALVPGMGAHGAAISLVMANAVQLGLALFVLSGDVLSWRAASR